MDIFLLIFGFMCIWTGGSLIGFCLARTKNAFHILFAISWGVTLMVGGHYIWTNASVIAKTIG